MLAWVLKIGLTSVIALAALAIGINFFEPYVFALAYHLNIAVFFFLSWLVEPDTARYFVLGVFLGAVFTIFKKVSNLFR